MRKNHSPNKKKLILLVALLLAAGLLGFFVTKNRSQNQQNPPTTAETDTINYGPPTDEETKAGETQNESETRQNNKPPVDNSTNLKQVTPVITSADEDRVTAYIPGIVEENGTCTAVFTNKSTSQKVTRTSKGFVNVSYTSCSPISPQLSAGSWSVTVSYKSAYSEGTSEPDSFEVR